ncbi:MAG: dipeptidase [Thermoguttaceae bacterium]|nr:dipeptidase [Thermoguttaceae bacterium]
MREILEYLNSHREEFVRDWFEALRIPSISCQPEHASDVQNMADWLIGHIKNDLKFQTRKIDMGGHPIVYAESPKVEGAPVVLVYGHYDVQPVDPLDQWISPPFEPTIRDGNVYCRGADDDKGQLLTHLFGAKAWLDCRGKLPFQLKFVFEGEEEKGSESLEKFLDTPECLELFAADVIVVSDSQMPGPDMPGICYGLRGVVGFELFLTGPNRDVHSGHYGGSICNPATILASLLASVVDNHGVVQVPGFYEGVVELTADERRKIAEVPFDEKESLSQIGMDHGYGDPAFTPLERRGARPAFDINGLTSGYQGVGGKTIIPSVASAKFTFRTVPYQDAAGLEGRLRTFFEEQLPPGVKMKLVCEQATCGMVVPLTSKWFAAAEESLEETFGRKPVYTREGGSIPVVAKMRDVLGSDVLLVGIGLPDDGIHSPNEKFSLDSFYKGMECSARLLGKIAEKCERS